jgi:hypothetical protein
MKVKVNRVLSAGRYRINFEVGDFSADEISKMESFGVPSIKLRWYNANGALMLSAVDINRINSKLEAAFATEAEAKDYEQAVLNQLREEMLRLRERQDKFSSSEEVAL